MTINKKDPEYIINPNYDPNSPVPTSRYLIREDAKSSINPEQGMTKEERDKFWDETWKDKSIPEMP